jgi:hypothetical protein
MMETEGRNNSVNCRRHTHEGMRIRGAYVEKVVKGKKKKRYR